MNQSREKTDRTLEGVSIDSGTGYVSAVCGVRLRGHKLTRARLDTKRSMGMIGNTTHIYGLNQVGPSKLIREVWKRSIAV